MQTRMILALAALMAASAWCLALLAARLIEVGQLGYPGIIWNLTLAWVPLLLALAMLACAKRGKPRSVLIALGCVWLLFLPNAPYLLTEFVHLGYSHRLFDSLIFASYGATGLALGLMSVVIVHSIVARTRGVVAGWTVAAASLIASSVGIYLGRVQRLNSWDALTQPRRILGIGRRWLDDPLAHRHLLVVLTGLAVCLMLAYFALYAFTSLVARTTTNQRPS